jgi:hypothetical protein
MKWYPNKGGISLPKQNFMTVAVPDSVQLMFDEFTRTIGTTKTAALTDMFELYMLARDETLYLRLKKKYLNAEGVKDMILAKEEVFDSNSLMCDIFLFMKLGVSSDRNGNEFDGEKTIQIYRTDAAKRGYTWFSTEALYFGMAKKQVEFFKNRIAIGQTVKILFAIGNYAGGDNEIAYSAEVLDIVSNQIPSSAPEDAYPDIWKGEKARIWIKIRNIVPETDITADKLVVISTGALLKPIITNSQYHFGYVKLREK